MKVIKFTIQGELTDLNTYISAERKNRFLGAKIKREETDRCRMEAVVARLQPIARDMYPVVIQYRWYTKNARKDVDNVIFAKKFISDGLVEAGVLIDDNRKHVALQQDQCVESDKTNPRVEVIINLKR